MRARWRLAQAARELEPLAQGDLDGLCGFYAIMNAIRLATHPRTFSRRDLTLLTQPALRALARTRRLSIIYYDGMHPAIWEKMVEMVLGALRTEFGADILIDDLFDPPPVDRNVARQAIKQALRDGHPVVTLFTRRLEHWTVATGYSRSRLILFDSSGHRWVTWAKVELDGDQGGLPHGLFKAYAVIAESQV